MDNVLLLRTSVTTLYVGYLVALIVTLFAGFFHETLVVCLSAHFAGLFGGGAYFLFNGAAWADPYPKDKLGFYRNFIITTDLAQFCAWVYASVSLAVNYENEILLTIAGSLTFIGVVVCFAKFYLIINSD